MKIVVEFLQQNISHSYKNARKLSSLRHAGLAKNIDSSSYIILILCFLDCQT